MLVEEIMNKNLITIQPDETIKRAGALLKKHRVRHLPVVNENKLIGIVSDRDIRDANPSIFHTNGDEMLLMPVENVMSKNVITAHSLDSVEELASVFYEHQIGCIPVTNEDTPIGIITETDMFYTLVQLTGAHQPSTQIEVQVENVSGKLTEVASIISANNVNIASVLVYPGKVETTKILVFRIQTMNPTGIINDIEQRGYQVLWPNVPGVSYDE